jgi:hypothetical protein
MKSIRKISLALFFPALGFTLFLLFSGGAAANPATPSMDLGVFFIVALILMAINFPFNLLLYLLFAFPLMCFRGRKDPRVFEQGSLRFLRSTLLLVFVASLFGGFIDIFVFSFYFAADPMLLIGLGLGGIFLSFFSLSLVLHKLRIIDAALVALGIIVANIVFWFFIGVFVVNILVFLAADVLILLILMPLVFFLYEERHMRLHYREWAGSLRR